MLQGREPTPWERRGELGIFLAFWLQWRDSMFDVDVFWRKVRPEGPPQDALYYAWSIRLIDFLIGAPLIFLPMGLMGTTMRDAIARSGGMGLPSSFTQRILEVFDSPGGWLIILLYSFLVSMVLYPLWLIVASALLHLLCMLFGCAKNGFWATFRVVCYACSPLVLGTVPYLNILVMVYFVVLTIGGIMRVHESTGGRAAAAVLSPIALFCCCCAGFGAVGVGLGMAAAARHGGFGP